MQRDLDALREEQEREERREHKALPKVERAYRDLIKVLDRLKKYANMTYTQVRKTPDYTRTTERLLRQYHRLNRIIHQYNMGA